jgi:hypothetical protein
MPATVARGDRARPRPRALLAGVADDARRNRAGELALLGNEGDRVVAATHELGGADEIAERPEECAREPPGDQENQRQRSEDGEHQDAGEMAIQGRDRRERATEAQDPRAAAAVVNETGGVEGVETGGITVTDGAAFAAGERLGDLRSGEVIVHRRQLVVLAFAVGEHRAVEGHDGDAEIGPLDELSQTALEREVGSGEAGRRWHCRDQQLGVLGELGGRALGERPRQQDRRQDCRQGERRESRPERGETESGSERVGHGARIGGRGEESALHGPLPRSPQGWWKRLWKSGPGVAAKRAHPAFFSVLHCFLCSRCNG